ncbi:hypothetical protein [Flavihumibacter petaseus]|uniref:Quercetin 2,3-dioxygenase C-terminal cupin domain-containing protein n=1 Tax=Flavihumibacter petaseus NBRC 106054 TaxID=1220578 RepID=A0A0E9MZE3_9BACT|nr:hypothetical protein [Flavihumibacter petaseus]GAO42470.1 hypothetical protein FPE01S_01_14840 [Flavihumibacter petaseus NBRC 106054]
MALEVSGKIFLHDQHGLTQSATHRQLKVFNGGSFQVSFRKPFGPLTRLDEETLAGQTIRHFDVTAGTATLLLPVAGPLIWRVGSEGISQLLISGNLLFLQHSEDSVLEIKNPYSEVETLINFIHISFQINLKPEMPSLESSIIPFVLEAGKPMTLIQLADTGCRFGIGKLAGKQSEDYFMTNREHAVMIYSLQGAFDIEGRLLHPSDALMLWDLPSADIEALSNNAICFTLEFPYKHDT